MDTTALDIYNNDVIIQSISLFKEQQKIVKDLVITEENEAYVADILGDNKAQRVAIEGERKKLLTPIDKKRGSIISQYREILAPMEEFDLELRNKMEIYLHERKVKEEQKAEALRLKELGELQEKRDTAEEELKRTGDADKADEIDVIDAIIDNVQHATIRPKKSISGRESKSSVSYRWVYEVEDVNKLPREYMMPNTTLLTKIVQGEFGVHKIKGCRIWQKPTVSTKRK